MVLPAQQRLGPYDLVRNLTRPGRAEVYVGKHSRDMDWAGAKEWPDTAVVKVLRPPEQIEPSQQARVQEALARFVEEGRLGLRLRHPAIVRTYGVATDGPTGLNFIVQEYAEGISLAQILERFAETGAPIPFNVVLRLAIPVLKALHFGFHEALREDGRPLRVVHRDLKPANIMLTWDGRPLLLDLAAARSTSFTRQATVQDVIVTTAHYLAPEQVLAPDSVSHQTDIFALGVILFELCTLSPLLPRTRRLSEVITALTRFNFADHAPRLDAERYPGLHDALAQALSPDPTTRYQTAGELARDLEGLLLRAGDGPGLPTFASQLRKQWEGESASRGDERRGVVSLGPARKTESAPVSEERPAPAEAPKPSPSATVPEEPRRTTGQVRAPSSERQPVAEAPAPRRPEPPAPPPQTAPSPARGESLLGGPVSRGDQAPVPRPAPPAPASASAPAPEAAPRRATAPSNLPVFSSQSELPPAPGRDWLKLALVAVSAFALTLLILLLLR